MGQWDRFTGSICILIACLVLGSCTGFTLTPAPRAELERDANTIVNDWEILVLFSSAEAAANMVPKAIRRGYRLNRRDDLNGLDLIMLSLTKPEGLTGAAAIRELERLEPGATAGVNHGYTWQVQTPTVAPAEPPAAVRGGGDQALGPDADLLYANALLDWPDHGCPAHSAVGMMDGPVDPSAAPLRRARIEFADFRPVSGTAINSAPIDAAHGTAVAELLVGPGRLAHAKLFAATVVSVGPDGRPMAGVGAMVRALSWFHTAQVRVVNISLAGPYNKILDRAVQSATRKGLILVAAAGNEGPAAPPRYPAAFDTVFAVTAIDRRLRVYPHAVHGEHVDFAAPGVDIYIGGTGNGRFMSGTSIAAPFVTSRISSTKGVSGGIRLESLRGMLSRETIDLGAPDRDPVFGKGLLKAPTDCRRAASSAGRI